MSILITFVIFTQLLASSLGNERPLINTSLGTIMGHYKNSYEGRAFAAFEGIPYAKPPIADLRFAEPQEPEPWSGIRETTTLHMCIQLPLLSDEPDGNEDCLYLNVYVPKDKLNQSENMDVLVTMHGGGFMIGSPWSLAAPEYLMDRDIVYVNLNYRLGAMGFLSTQDDVVSGNNGLKDQVMALKWVQNHIKHFGGNPQSVTIAGVSAGGASVHFHFFSPLSKGLFHRGILQSGTALCPWAMQVAPLETARRLAAAVDCTDSSTQDLIKCMRQRSAKQITKSVKVFDAFAGFPRTPFAPVIEKQSEKAFLTDLPYKLLNEGNVTDAPLLYTTCTEEGILGLLSVFTSLDQLNEQWNEVLQYVLDYNYTVAIEDRVFVAQKIKEYYFNGQPVTVGNIQSFIKLYGDRQFILGFEKSSRMHAKLRKSSVFSYVFGYRADNKANSPTGKLGVGHGEDSHLIYPRQSNTTSPQQKLSESDNTIKEMLLDFFTSFAKDGVPRSTNISWEAVEYSEDFNYLLIQKPDDIKMVSVKEVAPTEFWDSLPIKENEKFE